MFPCSPDFIEAVEIHLPDKTLESVVSEKLRQDFLKKFVFVVNLHSVIILAPTEHGLGLFVLNER